MRQFIVNERLSLRATTPAAGAYLGANFVIVATTIDYDPEENCFDTSSVEGVRKLRMHNSIASIVIKLTIPVRFTEQLRHKF